MTSELESILASFKKDLLKLSKQEIVKKCKQNKLPTNGKKADMVSRLIQQQRKKELKKLKKKNKITQSQSIQPKEIQKTAPSKIPIDPKYPLRFNQHKETPLIIQYFSRTNNMEIPNQIINLISTFCYDDRIVFWNKYDKKNNKCAISFMAISSFKHIERISIFFDGTYVYLYEKCMYPGGFAMYNASTEKHCGIWDINVDKNKIILKGFGFQDADPKRTVRTVEEKQIIKEILMNHKIFTNCIQE